MTYYNYLGQAMPETPAEESRISGDPNRGGETITSPAGAGSLSGEGGGDTLVGNSSGNRFYIVDPRDKVVEQPGGGVDTMIGWQYLKAAPNVENLIIHKDLNNAYGNDLDNLIVTDGRSWMYGGRGNDVMVGVNTTTSTYVVRPGEGNDVIYNWAGNSQLQLWDSTMKTGADVRSHMSQQGADTILRLSSGETLTFRDTSLSSFSDKQFLLTLDRAKLGAKTFGDEFDTLSLYDPSHQTGTWNAVFPNNPKDIWSYSLPSNGEEQVYVTPNFEGSGDRALEINPFSLNNGVLTITSRHLTSDQMQSTWGHGYASGMINTLDLFEQKYGYFEARIQLPTNVQGAWPAFWTIPWPYKGGQEGDAMEALSDKEGYDYRRAYGTDSYLFDNALKVDPGGFHTYGMLWTRDTVTFYYDDVAVLTGPTPANWTAPMAMVLNLATGGAWPGQANPADFPAGMQIDFVHAYALADGSSEVSIQKPATYTGVMTDGGAGGAAATIAFQDTGAAISSAPVVRLNHAPVAADLPAGRAFIVWEDAGAVFGAQSTNGVLDARTTIIAGTIGQFGPGTFLSDGRMAVTYLQDGNPAKEVWIGIIDPRTHTVERHELGDGVGGVSIIPTANGGFVASWHTASGAVEGRAYVMKAYDDYGYYAPIRDLPGDVTGITASGSVLAGGQAFTLTGYQPATAPNTGGGKTVIGAEGPDTIYGGDGDNYLRGMDGDDTITGAGHFDNINGNKGQDLVHGGAGQDWVLGGQGDDRLYGDEDFDIVNGNLGDDTVDGGAGADWVRGGQGNDSVSGGDGDDVLWGDRGSDTLSGGTGADIFHAFVGAGLDRIVDFNAGAGDRLLIEGGASYSASQVGGDTVIRIGAASEDQVVLVGVNMSSLGSAWIIA